MSVWMYRGGRNDEFLPLVLEFGWLILGFRGTPDLSNVRTEVDLRREVEKNYPQKRKGTITKFTNEISNYLWSMQPGDAVIMPCESGQSFRIGQIIDGPYRFEPDLHRDPIHVRPANWLHRISREQLPPGLWSLLKGRQTIRKIPEEYDLLKLFVGSPVRQFQIPNSSSVRETETEGVRRRVEVALLSRNRRILDLAWSEHQSKYGGQGQCEVCVFTHPDKGMFDIHHLDPIALGRRETAISDLAILCPRCHRMAHHGRSSAPYNLDEIRAINATLSRVINP